MNKLTVEPTELAEMQVQQKHRNLYALTTHLKSLRNSKITLTNSEILQYLYLECDLFEFDSYIVEYIEETQPFLLFIICILYK